MSTASRAADRPRNRPAVISAYAAAGSAVYASGSVMGGWLTVTYSVPILGLLIICALVAVVSGHMGRRRAKRQGVEGRWLSLAAMVVGWLCIVYAVMVNLVVLGLIAGLSALFGSAG